MVPFLPVAAALLFAPLFVSGQDGAQKAFTLPVAINHPTNLKFDSYDAELFSPLEDLNLLSFSEFTTLKHPKFPEHAVRVKKSRFCDGTVEYVLSTSHMPLQLAISRLTLRLRM